MQTALNFAPALFSCVPASAGGKISFSTKLVGSASPRFSPIRAATAAATYEIPTVDYSSSASVFPAEACETIGGDACLANMYPEVKLKPENRKNTPTTGSVSELAERDYVDYTAYPKTVLLGEACDVLGGEFCQRPYQRGIY